MNAKKNNANAKGHEAPPAAPWESAANPLQDDGFGGGGLGWPLLYCVEGELVAEGMENPHGLESWEAHLLRWDDATKEVLRATDPETLQVYVLAGRFQWDNEKGRGKYNVAGLLRCVAANGDYLEPVVFTWKGNAARAARISVRSSLGQVRTMAKSRYPNSPPPPAWAYPLQVKLQELSGRGKTGPWRTVCATFEPPVDLSGYNSRVPEAVEDVAEDVAAWRAAWEKPHETEG